MQIIRKAIGFVIFLAIVGVIHAQPPQDPDCPREVTWTGKGGDSLWTDSSNWVRADGQVVTPDDVSQVILSTPNQTTTITEGTVQVSFAKVSNNHLLKISKNAKLIVENIEVHCWDVNWCSGHGNCSDIDVCTCDEGWSGSRCNIPSCNATNVCGACTDTPLGSEPYCICGNYLTEPTEELNKLLLVETNKMLINSLLDTMMTLDTIRFLAKKYKPIAAENNTLSLEPQIIEWLGDVQEFCDGTLEPFVRDNWNFWDTMVSTPLMADPCVATPQQNALEAYLDQGTARRV